MENRILRELNKTGQIKMILSAEENPVKVSLGQFYGIEINDFAVAVARTALWIAEDQMMKETRDIAQDFYSDVLPLKDYDNIIEGNALRLNWDSIVPKEKLNYIMGNPPFQGHQQKKTKEQVRDIEIAFGKLKKCGKLDYVCAWYAKAAGYIAGTKIKAAYVSTDSICQGESVGILWPFLFSKGIRIFFAYRPFRWKNEAEEEAKVYVVIVGFSYNDGIEKRIFDKETSMTAANINGYLLDGPNFFIKNRSAPFPGLPRMKKGSQPTDGGHLILSSKEAETMVKQFSQAASLIRPYMGADELLNGYKRYCLWLEGVAPEKYRDIPSVMQRLKLVTESRKKSPTKSVQEATQTPALFTQIRQPESSHFLCVPEVSSGTRTYIPMGYLDNSVIASNKLQIIPDASLYMFGVLTSRVHMAWIGVLCCRRGTGYSYSPSIYHNFPWPSPTGNQRAKIEQTAQGILDTRALYPDSSLADLYDELTMPADLRKAHKANDAAVMSAYGFGKDLTEPEIVARLMGMYEELTR